MTVSSRWRPGVSKHGLTQTYNKPLSFRQTNNSLTERQRGFFLLQPRTSERLIPFMQQPLRVLNDGIFLQS